MKNKQKLSYLRRTIKFFIVPLFLLLLWFGLTILYIINLDTAFSLLSYNLPKTVFTYLPQSKLVKGDLVAGEFRAEEDNLGILSVRFQTFFRPRYEDEDNLLFQIKQKGARSWYYQSIYRDGLIYDVPFYPFGFPVITRSKGRIYEFRISSLKGNSSNAVAISMRWQNIAAKYKFTKEELVQSKIELLKFSFKKFISSFQTIDVLFSSCVYLLPLLFYLMLLSPLGKYFEPPLIVLRQKISHFGRSKYLRYIFPNLKSSQQFPIVVFDIILLCTVLIDGFYLQLGNDFIYMLVPMLWLGVQRSFAFPSRKTFIVGFIILLVIPIFLLFKLGQIAENLAAWSYLFFAVGIIHAMLELESEQKR